VPGYTDHRRAMVLHQTYVSVEMRSFVEDYEDARLEPFDGDEREVLDAANQHLGACDARWLHSDLAPPRRGRREC
jgi:hypothetical protein